MAQILADSGVETTVVTASEDTFHVLYGADPTLIEAIPSGVEVLRVAQASILNWPIINDWPMSRASNPQVWARKTLDTLSQTFPEGPYVDWIAPASVALQDLHRRHPIDLVIATAAPYVSFEIAIQFHESTGVPVVLDDRDSFTYDVLTGARRPAAGDPWMRRFAQCHQYWVVNPPIADLTRDQFPFIADKVRLVENGWDARFLDPSGFTESEGANKAAFVGTVTKGFPVADLMDTWRRVRDSQPQGELAIVGNIGFRQTLGRLQREQRDTMMATPGVAVSGRMAKQELQDLYATTDVLLFVKEGGGLVTSGKIYEYMATGRPIVALCSPDLDTLRVMAGYPRMWQADFRDHAAGAAAIAAAFDAVGDGRLAQGQAHGAQFERRAILEPVLNDLLAEVSA